LLPDFKLSEPQMQDQSDLQMALNTKSTVFLRIKKMTSITNNMK
jgi:hypothetical protein